MDDDTPPGGIYVGQAEDQVVLDAHAIGRALERTRSTGERSVTFGGEISNKVDDVQEAAPAPEPA